MSHRIRWLRIKLVLLIMRSGSRADKIVPRVSENLEVLPNFIHAYRLGLRYQAQSGAVIKAIRNSLEAIIVINLGDILLLIAEHCLIDRDISLWGSLLS